MIHALCDCNLTTVFIADTGKAVYVWIGSGASKDEKKQAMAYAHVSEVAKSSAEYSIYILFYAAIPANHQTSSSASDLPQ